MKMILILDLSVIIETMKTILVTALFHQFLVNSMILESYIKNKITDGNKIEILQNKAKSILKITTWFYGNKNQDVIVLFRQQTNDDALLITTNYPIIIINEENISEEFRDVRNRGVAYIFNNLPISEILDSIAWDSKTRFIVVCSDQTEVQEIFTEFWEERNVNVVAMIHANDSNIELLTYFPYTNEHCEEVGNPVLLKTLNETTRINVPLFPEKLTDLRKCPLLVTLLERPPSAMETDDGNIIGVEVQILKLVADAINATPVVQFLHRKKQSYKTRGNTLMLELIENHSHVVAGSLMLTTSVSLLSEGIQYSESLCITIAVPRIRKHSFFYIFKMILSKIYFFSMVTVTLLCILFLYVLSKLKETGTTFSETAWTVLSPLTGGPPVNPKRFAARSFFAAWLFAAFMFCRVFEASVSSTILAPQKSRQLETIDDVLKSRLTLQGETFIMAEVLPRYLTPDSTATIDRRGILSSDAMKRIAKYGNAAYMGTEKNLLYTFQQFPEIKDGIYVQEQCVLKYQPVIQLRKRSPFYEIFSKYIRALTECGIVRNSFQTFLVKFFKEREAIDTDIKPLTIYHVMGAFVVLFFGLFTSFVCFMAEICFYSACRKKVT